MKIENITIAGGGVLGSQIAFQSAYKGFNVTIWLRSEDSIKRAKPKLDNLKNIYIDVINKMDTEEGKTFDNWCRGIADINNFNKKDCLSKVIKASENIKLETDVNKAFGNADLVIEAMSENLNDKKDFYKKIATILPEKTIVVTNSSTLLPSKLAKYTGREHKFLALHFANSIWKNNTAEVMAQPKTDEKYFNDVVEFAKKIGMIALPLKKEKSGYLLNSMLVPFLFSALDLLVNEISDVKSIDSAWKLGTGAPEGPFEILDVVGLNTAYEIVQMYVKIPSFLAPYNFKGMAKLLKQYIDEGKLGKNSGEGFYKYNGKQ
jgi:3-hydroxyacyl-CoA dehydrogenase